MFYGGDFSNAFRLRVTFDSAGCKTYPYVGLDRWFLS